MKATKGAKTKKRLYDTALELFQHEGYAHVSVDDIVREAGVAKGTFYSYFSAKAQIVLELIAEYDDYYDEVYNQLDEAQPVCMRMETLARACFRFTLDVIGLDLVRVLYQSSLMQELEVGGITDVNRALFRIFCGLIEEGQETGELISHPKATELTAMALRSLRGTMYDWCVCNGEFDLIQSGREYFAVFLNGIRAKNSLPIHYIKTGDEPID